MRHPNPQAVRCHAVRYRERYQVSANSFGLLNSLAAILNSQRRDSDYAIARYLIERLSDINALSITDIMENAFVTRSAVRRFCNRVGFDSFSDFKARMTTAAYPSDLNHRDLELSIDGYRATLDSGISNTFEKLHQAVRTEDIVELAQDMHARTHVVLVCAGNTTGVLERFQQELFYVSKFVQLTTDTYRERLQHAAWNPDSLLVVVSASGVFARESAEWLREIDAEKRLVTACPSFDGQDIYDRIYQLRPEGDESDFDRLGLFGKYGTTYFFDLLSACYLSRFA